MVTVESFVALPPGKTVPLEGRVENCPVCGRSGIEQRLTDGGKFVVHVQTTEMLGDGLITEPQDCCDLTRPRRA